MKLTQSELSNLSRKIEVSDELIGLGFNKNLKSGFSTQKLADFFEPCHPASIHKLEDFLAFYICRYAIDFGFSVPAHGHATDNSFLYSRRRKENITFKSMWGQNPGYEGLHFACTGQLVGEYFKSPRASIFGYVLNCLLEKDDEFMALCQRLATNIQSRRKITQADITELCFHTPVFFHRFPRKSFVALNLAVKAYKACHPDSDSIECALGFPADLAVLGVLQSLGYAKVSNQLAQRLQPGEIVYSGSPQELGLLNLTVKAGEAFAKHLGITYFEAYQLLMFQAAKVESPSFKCYSLEY